MIDPNVDLSNPLHPIHDGGFGEVIHAGSHPLPVPVYPSPYPRRCTECGLPRLPDQPSCHLNACPENQ